MRDEHGNDAVSALCLQQSGTGISLTGTLLETDLLTVTIPPLAGSPIASLRAYLLWTWTNNANNKILRAYYGAGNCYGPTVTVSGFAGHAIWLFQDGPNTQRGLNSSSYLASASALFNIAQDATKPQPLRITGQLANVADVLTLQAHCIELLGYANL